VIIQFVFGIIPTPIAVLKVSDIRTCLSELKLVLGQELKILYPLILTGELELNGLTHPKFKT